MKKVLFLWTSESSKWKLMLHCDHQRNRKKRMYSQIIGRCVHRPNWHNYLELLTFHTFTYISSLEFPYVNFSSVYEMHICIFNAPQHLMEIECCFFLFNFNSRSFHQLIFMQTASFFSTYSLVCRTYNVKSLGNCLQILFFVSAHEHTRNTQRPIIAFISRLHSWWNWASVFFCFILSQND